MRLEVIEENMSDNDKFSCFPDCIESIKQTVEWYKQIGFVPPWIGYFSFVDGKPVGSCAFKGAPKAGKVELAYMTYEEERGKGYGTEMCRLLKQIGLDANSDITVTARTLREAGHSTRILESNGFEKTNDLIDFDGTPVWEWVLLKN